MPPPLENHLQEPGDEIGSHEGQLRHDKGMTTCGRAMQDAEEEEEMISVLKRIRASKREARSELSVSQREWSRHSYHADEKLLSTDGLEDHVPRMDCAKLTVEEFAEQFEGQRRPCVITGLVETWPMQKPPTEVTGQPSSPPSPSPSPYDQWSMQGLLEKFASHRFKVGTDDEGDAVRLSLSKFLFYCTTDHEDGAMWDDSPLYIFDGTFDDRASSKDLLDMYKVPLYFEEDLFR